MTELIGTKSTVIGILVRTGVITEGRLTHIEHSWKLTFAMLPRRLVNEKWIWCKPVYVRRVWRSGPLGQVPSNEYCTVFDLLTENYDNVIWKG